MTHTRTLNGLAIVAASRHTSREAEWKRRDPDVHDRSDRLVTSLYKEMPPASQKIPVGYPHCVKFSVQTQESDSNSDIEPAAERVLHSRGRL
jgi:hypothetical protein